MTHQEAISTLAPERYLLDEMSEPERETFEEHYFSCAECADDVRAGALMRDGVRAGLLDARSNVHDLTESAARRRPASAVRSRGRWYQSAAIPWAAAAALALVAGYQTFATVPARRIVGAPLALSPITLRPASRGREPQVPVARGAAAITLAVDAGSAGAGRSLPYDLRTADGIVVASGDAPSPASGAPVLLLIPAQAFKAPGHYVLSIDGSQYPFEVVAQ